MLYNSFNLNVMAGGIEKFIVAVEMVTPHEDGGTVADFVGGVTNASREEAEGMLRGIYDFSAGSLSRRIRAEKGRRNNAHFGYTGNWGTTWNPHDVDQSLPRGDDGEIIYQ